MRDIRESVFDMTFGLGSYGLCSLDELGEIKTEKPYRPFKNVSEFRKHFSIGSMIRIKRNGYDENSIIMGYREGNDKSEVLVGVEYIPLNDEETLENVKIFDNGVWKPFGVKS